MDFLILTCLFGLLFLGVADNQATLALLPSIGQSFDARILGRGFLITAYSLGAAVASLGAGMLSDHYGRKRFLQWAILVFGVSSWLTSRMADFHGLVLTRVVTGLAAGTLSTCTLAFAGDWFAYRVRGRAVGIISSAYFAGPILGVPAATELAERMGWQSAYVVLAGGALLGWILTLRLPQDRPGSERMAVSGIIRVARETFRGFLGRRDTVGVVGVAFLVSGGLVGFLAYLSQWLREDLGLATSMVGMIWMFGGLVALIGAPLGGLLADRWGKKSVAVGSNILLALALISIPWTRWGIPLLILFGLISLASAFRQGPLTALITGLVSRKQRGSLIALRNVSSQLGIAASTVVGGIFYEQRGYPAVTLTCALMTLGAVYLLAAHIREPRDGEPARESS